MTTVAYPAAVRDSFPWSVVLLMLYAVAMAVLFQIRTVPLTGYETDGVYYMIGSRTLFTEEFRPPSYGGGIGMPVAIRAVNTLVPDTFAAAKIVSAAAGFLYLMASLRVAAHLLGPSTALVTAALLFLNPWVLTYSSTSLSDMLGAALPMLAIWALLYWDRRWLVFLSGLCLGLGWTTRPINMVFWPLVLAPALRVRSRPVALQFLGLGSLGLVAGAVPQMVTNALFYGSPLYTDNWRVVVAALHDWSYATRIESFATFLREDWTHLGPVWAGRLALQLPETMLELAYWPALLAVPGYITALRQSKRPAIMGLWGGTAMLYLFLVAPAYRIELRYLLPVLPLVLASGVTMWRALMNGSRNGLVAGLVVAILIGLGATVDNVGERVRTQAPELKQAGLLLHGEAGTEDVILASQLHVFFYAERPGMLLESLSQEELDRLGKSVNDRRIAWVVFDSRHAARSFPTLSWLLDPNSLQAKQLGWRLAFYLEEPERLTIWRTR